MNSTYAQAAASPLPAVNARPRGTTLLTLVRREFWEHRALWIAPLIAALLLVVCATIGTFHMDLDDSRHLTEPQDRVALFTVMQWVVAGVLYVVAVVVLSFYLLDCLYAERKDRSILFWKSMPVSDGMTVWSKCLVAFVVVPLGVYLLAIVAGFLFSGILAARLALAGAAPILGWDTLEWLRSELAMLLIVILGILWYAPIGACLLLLSAWARRIPFLWAMLPPVVAPLLELIAFGTHHIWNFELQRTAGIWWTLGIAHAHIFSHHGVRPLGTLLAEADFGAAFSDSGLWLGVVFTAAAVFAATRIRRYRDDT
jgi:ABC-2 type transport system permease protein